MKNKKILFKLLIVVIGSVILSELAGQLVLGTQYNCEPRLQNSGIYKNQSEYFIKNLCDDYEDVKTVQPVIRKEQEVMNFTQFIDKISLQNYKILSKQNSDFGILQPNQHSRTINSNEYGFRGREISMNKDDDTYRIIILGGSVAYGRFASSDEATISGNLEKMFSNNDNPKIQVINAALEGDTSCSDIKKTQEYLIKFDPDVIVILGGWNDLDRPCTDSEEISRISVVSALVKPIMSMCPECQSPRLIILSSSWIKFQIDKIIGNTITYDKDLLITNLVKKWATTCEIGKQHNFDVIIALQPLLGTENKTITEWEKQILKNYPSDAVLLYPKLKESMNELQSECKYTVDLTHVFDNTNDTVFIDRGHIGDNGNFLIAKKLHEVIRPLVEKR